LRQFDTGATRDTDEGKLDYEGFLCPYVLKRFGEYMNKNRVQADGNVRDSDNWQKGIPLDAYMKSAWRHFHDLWTAHREGDDVQEHICALMFNVMGYLHETLKRDRGGDRKEVMRSLQEVVTEIHDELAAGRKFAPENSGPKSNPAWDEGCSGGMGGMAPSFQHESPSKLGQCEPNQQEKL
jgi:hypothetical protein